MKKIYFRVETFFFGWVYIQPKKCYYPKILFFHLIISLSFLEFEWKILYQWKAIILNFFMMEIFFVFWRFFELWIFEQKSCIFFHIKKYHFSNSNQKNIFFVKTCNCIGYFGKKLLPKIVFINCVLRFWITH